MCIKSSFASKNLLDMKLLGLNAAESCFSKLRRSFGNGIERSINALINTAFG